MGSTSESYRLKGNTHFSNGEYNEAEIAYSKAIVCEKKKNKTTKQNKKKNKKKKTKKKNKNKNKKKKKK